MESSIVRVASKDPLVTHPESPRGDVAESKVTRSEANSGESKGSAAATEAERPGWEELREDDGKS